jgi:hypothetical protein
MTARPCRGIDVTLGASFSLKDAARDPRSLGDVAGVEDGDVDAELDPPVATVIDRGRAVFSSLGVAFGAKSKPKASRTSASVAAGAVRLREIPALTISAESPEEEDDDDDEELIPTTLNRRWLPAADQIQRTDELAAMRNRVWL